MRRFLAIFLLTMLPLQFSWAAVATYCGHESQASTGHFGHHDHDHDHEHHADAGSDAGPAVDAGADLTSSPDEVGGANGDKAPSAMDLDCGHCHGTCSAMLTLPMGLPGALSTALPSVTVDKTGGAHAPTRPERPQWLPLA
ncbi:hypothetical protein ABE607_16300 [Comamonas aquatica]|uniref:hypothetical protein n=1 Tax=Comamonas aquatica TaxID=225991 RepID=UPI001B35B0A0|nr:hypothetical protein [Comamonas aquatica]MDH1765571.1 hypothetical protein [Comamonas aquatica]QTX22440.1 hypothetical protein KAQ61_08540 [Comamonas aquatica]